MASTQSRTRTQSQIPQANRRQGTITPFVPEGGGAITPDIWLPFSVAQSNNQPRPGAVSGTTNVNGDMILGPGDPPQPILDQRDAGGLPAPRYREYGVSANLLYRPRSEETQRTAFDILRAISANYDVAAICHNALCSEIYALDWAIVPRDSQDPAAKTRHAAKAKKMQAFWQRPDGDLYFDEWATMLLREDLEIGAPVIFKHRNRAGDKIGAFEIIQGETIKPVIDIRGKTIAFQQIYRGLPGDVFPGDSIVYRPRIRRRDSAYGVSPLEMVLLNINTALRKQTFDMSYWTEGSTPEWLVGLDPANWTPTDVASFQEYFDDLLSGNDAQRHRIRFYPGDPSKAKEFKVRDPETAIQEWALRITCAAHNVAPEEIGFMAKATRATGNQQHETQRRKGIGPLVTWLESVISNIIQTDMGQPELAFKYQLGNDAAEILQQAQADALYLTGKVYSPGWIRHRDGVSLQEDDPILLQEEQEREAILNPPPIPPQLMPGQQGQPGGQQGQPTNPAEAQGTPLPPTPNAADAQARTQAGANPGKAPNNDHVSANNRDKGAGAASKADAVTDLRRWRDKSVRKMVTSQRAGVVFQSDYIPDDVAALIRADLERATSVDGVREVFARCFALATL